MRRDLRKAKNRRALWNQFDWFYKDSWKGFLRKNHSLNCYCSQCRDKTFQRRYATKKERIRSRQQLRRVA